MRNRLLRIATRSEGGEMFSLSLRRVLHEHFGVSVADYAYGSLLEPGRADRFTSIGPYASIGPNVRRIGAAHPVSAVSMHPFWYRSEFGYVGPGHDVERTPCEIGADAWIGANVTILPGCRRIGVGAVIGAGAVVTKDVEDFEMVVGVPAKRIGIRFAQSAQEQILASRYWELDPAAAALRLRELESPISDAVPEARD
ncbi:MAG: CatB-related O-acetyltransferase [Microbacterium sp.]|nr:CatB-related O-acetyltransferase [Microbacterium sp.]